MSLSPTRGFTLIEVMVTVAIVAILASIALPAYGDYVRRSRVPPALDALNSYALRMEQRFQDVGSYANGAACGSTLPAPQPPNFTMACSLTGTPAAGTAFIATATGMGSMAGYAYTINSLGQRRTLGHPRGAPTDFCWSARGGTCDT
jgi:type IV pilus assembly protein PilE